MRYISKYFALLVLLFFNTDLFAQLLSVGQEGQLTIIAGTDFAVDKLILSPSKTFTLQNNSLKESKQVLISNTESSRKIYLFEKDIASFSGKILIKYNEKDVLGLDENQLKVQVNNSKEWNLLDSKPANSITNTVESLPFSYTNIKGLTIGLEKYKGEFSVINNPVVNNTLQVYVNTPQYLNIYSSDGKMILRKYFQQGINQIDMSKNAHSTYFIASPYTSLRFIL